MRDNKGFVCHAHREMVSYEIHHVWPTAYHGPNTADNKIKICPNAHSDIHFLMDHWLAGKPIDARTFSPSVKRYARQGYEAVTNYIEQELL